MDLNDLRLVCLHDTDNNVYTVYPENFKGLVVQVDDLNDAPKELGNLFEVMMKMILKDKNRYDIMTYDSNDFQEL